MKTFFRFVKRSWHISSKDSLHKYTLLLLTDPSAFDKVEIQTLENMIRRENYSAPLVSKRRLSRFRKALSLFWSVRHDWFESSERGLIGSVKNRTDGRAILLVRNDGSDTRVVLNESRVRYTQPDNDPNTDARIAAHNRRFNNTADWSEEFEQKVNDKRKNNGHHN